MKVINRGDLNRVFWIDIFRGILILSVIIGHSTGKFNGFIYQFHMGAFFLVSGFTTRQDARTILQTTIHRLLTLWLPVFSSLCILQFFVEILHYFGWYEAFLGTFDYFPFTVIVREFFLHGTIYVWWLGAAWFVLVLLGITLLHRILYQLLGNRYGGGYAAVSIALFLMGYKLSSTKWNLDLILIAQLYFVIGLYLQKLKPMLNRNAGKLRYMILAVATFGLMLWNQQTFHWTMDYPSRAFNNPIIDVAIVLNGTLFVFALSRLLEAVPCIRDGLAYLGRNTLPILLFHFVMFKIAFAMLYKVGGMTSAEFGELVPPEAVGAKYWWLITAVSISGCLAVWAVFKRVKLLRILFGQEKVAYQHLYEKMEKNRGFAKIDALLSQMEIPMNWIPNWREIRKTISRYHYLLIPVAIAVVLCMIPVIRQGIVVNDEVQAYQYRMQGLIPLIERNIGVELRQGRPMRIMAAFNAALSFLTCNITINRIFQCTIICAGFLSFSYYIYKLIKNFWFSAFLTTFMMLLYPATFEHATPNAFNGLTFVPMIELFLSMGIFCSYLESRNQKKLYVSGGLLLLALLGYEFMITFVPLYGLTYFYKCCIQKKLDIKRMAKAVGVCALTGVGYLLVLYCSMQMVRGDYTGTQIEVTSIREPLNILWTLFKSAIPGYWMTNKKYQFLFTIYSMDGIGSASYVRIFLLCITVAVLLTYILKRGKAIHTDAFCSQTVMNIVLILAAGVYCFLPSAANAVSKLYQGSISESNFTALPVTSFLYLFTSLICCFIIWLIAGKFKSKGVLAILVCAVVALMIPIQTMNDVFSKEQSRNTQRLLCINELFETNTLHQLSFQELYAPDLYKTKNALAVHDTYYASVSTLQGIEKLTVLQTDENKEIDLALFETGTNEWTLTTGNEVVVLSKNRLEGTYGLRVEDQTFVSVEMVDQGRDGSFYYYHFKKNADGKMELSSEVPFADIAKQAGNTLDTAKVITGIFQDGWVAPEANVLISTGELGKINVTGYYNGELTGKERISVYQDGELILEYQVDKPEISFVLQYYPNATMNLTMYSNFSFQGTPPDIRELSFVLTSLDGQ